MRKVPRTRAAAEIVDAIVEAAEQVLETEGVAALTTNRVAEHAGVSVGTLYQYFPNKYALAGAIFDRQIAAYDALFAAAIAAGGTPYDIILAIGDGLVAKFERRPNIHRALRALRTAAEVHERIDAMLAKMQVGMTALLVRQNIPEQRARDIAFVLVHGADGIANAIATSSDRDQGKRVARLFAEMAMLFYTPR